MTLRPRVDAAAYVRACDEIATLRAELEAAKKREAAMRSGLIYWARRAYDALGRQGWEEGPSAEETREHLHALLCNGDADPNEDDGTPAPLPLIPDGRFQALCSDAGNALPPQRIEVSERGEITTLGREREERMQDHALASIAVVPRAVADRLAEALRNGECCSKEWCQEVDCQSTQEALRAYEEATK